MKRQDFFGLTDTEVRNSLRNNSFTNEIADIYFEALIAKDTVIAVAAQDELSTRGDINLIRSCFAKACAITKIELGSSFSEALAESFIKMKNTDFILDRNEERIRLKDILSNTTLIEGIERKVKDDIIRRYGKYINLESSI